MEETPAHQVSPKEVVEELLNPKEGQKVELPLTADDLGLGEAKEDQTEAKKVVIPPDGTYADGDVGAKAIASLLKTPRITEKELELSAAEKETYLKALMHDEPLVLDISIPGLRIDVRVRSRNNFEQSLVTLAVARDIEAKEVIDFVTHSKRTMLYSSMFQLISFAGKPVSHLEFAEPIPQDQAIAQMRALLPKYENIGVRWEVYLTALQIFEGKLALASTNILNKDFFHPAD